MADGGDQIRPAGQDAEGPQRLTLQVDGALCRAFQRCTWILIHETGRSQLEIMDEMVRDFLKKHGC